jgi:hypothetical protein
MSYRRRRIALLKNLRPQTRDDGKFPSLVAYPGGVRDSAAQAECIMSASGHLRLCPPVSGAAGQPQEADSPNSIEPT